MSSKETPKPETKEQDKNKKDEKDKSDKNKDNKDNKESKDSNNANADDNDNTRRVAIQPAQVVVHPLVLLSVVDHYNRVAKDTKKRVVGVLLGETHRGKVDITNSYAVPFEEDLKEPTIWFLDHNYHENMFAMFKKVNAKERVVGWYSTGPKIRPADLEINELMRKYCLNPVMVIIDVNPKDTVEIPTQAYLAVPNSPELQSESRQTFAHLPCEIGAYEAEEVGVEHLLRDIRNSTESTLTDQVNAKLNSLLGLKKRMEEMYDYLTKVVEGRIPVNHQIIYNMQDIFNLCPNLKHETIVKSFAIKTNDQLLVIYLSSLVRSIIALHNLITNKADNRRAEQKEDDKGKAKNEKKDEKQKEEKEKKEKEKEDDANKKKKDNSKNKPKVDKKKSTDS